MKTDVQPQRQIVVDARTRAYLSRLMGVSERTVYNALGKDGGRSELQRRIRKAAIENGGMPTVTVSEDDAIFITGTDGARSMVEKPLNFDPFGHPEFAHLWLQYDCPFKVLVLGVNIILPF